MSDGQPHKIIRAKAPRRRASDLSVEERWRKQRRWGVTLILVALLAILLVFLRFHERRVAERAFPQEMGEILFPGPAALARLAPTEENRFAAAGPAKPVVVYRDRRGIPSLEAENEADLFWALGFVHAQDRLAQLLWLRASARGRASEWVGAQAFAADREARILGIAHHADRDAEKLSPTLRRVLEAYAAGVNARLHRIEMGLEAPPRILEEVDAPPQSPWTPADTLAVLKLYAWGLGSSLESSLVLNDLIQRLGGPQAVPFFPMDASCDLRTRPGQVEQRRGSDFLLATNFHDDLRSAIGLRGGQVGSSAWIVGGALSKSGKPLLAADSHAETTVPGLFYQASLRAADWSITGATLPGVPIVWTGHNANVAWASVHAPAVVTDLFVERLRPDSANRYHDGTRWAMIEQREEIIAVRGENPRRLVVRETNRGPLLDALLPEDSPPISLAWTGARESKGLEALLRAMHAQSADQFRSALYEHHEPVLAFVFADTAGAGGMQVAGWIPSRSVCTGLVPVESRSRDARWISRVPFSMLPALHLDANTTQIVVADNAWPTPAPIEWLWRPGERAARISQILDQAALRGESLTARALAQMQSDVVRPRARELTQEALAYLPLSTPRSPGVQNVLQLLKDWNGDTSSSSQGAAVYHVFADRFFRACFRHALGEELMERYLALPQSDPERAMQLVLQEARLDAPQIFPWVSRAWIEQAVEQSLEDTWIWLSVALDANREQWQWGRLHALQFRPLWPGAVRRSGSLGPFPFGGSRGTIASGEFDATKPFEVRVASTFRFVIDTERMEEALTSSVPGQSEHVEHVHQADQVADWLDGKSALLSASSLAAEESAVSTLRLVTQP